MNRSLPSFLVCMGLVLGTGTAFAQDTTKVAAAESLFQEAEKLEAAGTFELACGKYAESQQLDPGLGTLLHLAQCYEKAGKTASAWGRYKEALELAVRAGDQRSEIARKRADKLEPMLSKLTIVVTPQNQVKDLAVSRDGVAVGAPQWNLAIPVDPGEHVVVASAPGYLPTQAKITTPPSASAQKIEIPRLAVDPSANPDRVNGDPSRGKPQRITGIALMAVGGASLVAGGVLGITAKVTYDGANCNDQNECQGQADLDKRSSGKHQATASTILLPVGAGLAAIGAVVFFTAPKAGVSKDARRWLPQVGVGPTSVTLRGTF